MPNGTYGGVRGRLISPYSINYGICVCGYEKVRVLFASVIEDYKSGKITYSGAEFNTRNKIYHYVKSIFTPDVKYTKDLLSRDIP